MNALRNILIIVLLPCALLGQGKWDLGILSGGTTYQGDLVLSNGPLLSATKPAYGGFLRHTFDFQWSFRVNVISGQLVGSDQNSDDKYRLRRNFSFQSDLIETSVLFEWEPLGKRRTREEFKFYKILSPYLYAGIGGLAVNSNPNFYIGADDAILPRIEQDQALENPHLHPVIPFGLGVKIDLGKEVVIGAEIGSRATFTDYLDGISLSANSGKNDWYVFGGLSLSYRFKEKDEDKDNIADREDACPKIPGVISSRGCPDADEDGVEDLEDVCPEIAGLPELNGCPDSDVDGVADWEDACPTVFGSRLTLGCPDSDNDEIADLDDECPKLAGCICRQGCPMEDSTGDGIPDQKDRCTSSLNEDLIQPLKPIIELNKLFHINFIFIPINNESTLNQPFMNHLDPQYSLGK